MSKIGTDIIGKSKLSKQEKILAYKTYYRLFEGIDLDGLNKNWYIYKANNEGIVFRRKEHVGMYPGSSMSYFSLKIKFSGDKDYPFMLYKMNTKNGSWDFMGRYLHLNGIINTIKDFMLRGRWRKGVWKRKP